MSRLLEWPHIDLPEPKGKFALFLETFKQTQETNPMSTTRYAKKKTRDLAPGDIFIVEDPSRNITWTPARWRVLEFTPHSDRLHHEEGIIPVMREDVEENRVSWHHADATVYVEAEESRSGTDQRQSDQPRTEEVDRLDLNPGDQYRDLSGLKCEVVSVADSPNQKYYRILESCHYFPFKVWRMATPMMVNKILPDRRSGEERRSGD